MQIEYIQHDLNECLNQLYVRFPSDCLNSPSLLSKHAEKQHVDAV